MIHLLVLASPVWQNEMELKYPSAWFAIWSHQDWKENLESKHSNHVGTSIDAFKLEFVMIRKQLSSYEFAVLEKLLESSYEVLYMIVKEKKPHTIGETLVKPCALERVKLVLGENAAMQLSQVSLSNDFVHQRI